EKVDAEDFSGRTPLHYACSEAVASMLLNAGANLRHKSRNGMTPVHSAAQLGNVYTLGYFLRSGAPVSPVDHSKRTPLHWASLVGRQDIIELLLGCGADLLARDAKGRNPVHYAVLAENPNVSVLRALLRDGSSETGVERDAFKAKDADGNSPLLLATKAGHLKA
ncbi:ankyrin, partial [Ascobolus immersus RN42]